MAHVAGAFNGITEAGGNLGAGRSHRGVRIHHQQMQFGRGFRKLRDSFHGPWVKNCFEHCIRLMLPWLNGTRFPRALADTFVTSHDALTGSSIWKHAPDGSRLAA